VCNSVYVECNLLPEGGNRSAVADPASFAAEIVVGAAMVLATSAKMAAARGAGAMDLELGFKDELSRTESFTRAPQKLVHAWQGTQASTPSIKGSTLCFIALRSSHDDDLVPGSSTPPAHPGTAYYDETFVLSDI
jgi:hypothetical protein